MSFDPSFAPVVQVLSSIIRWTEQEIEQFTERLETRCYKRKTFLLDQDATCNGIWFINSGFCRLFRTVEGKEVTLHFAGEGDFTTNIEGILGNEVAPYAIQAAQNTQAVFISKENLEWAKKHIGEGEKLLRILWQKYCVLKMKEIFSLYNPDPLDRYRQLLKQFPDIQQYMPQNIIASYLNITPQYLSQLKASSIAANNYTNKVDKT